MSHEYAFTAEGFLDIYLHVNCLSHFVTAIVPAFLIISTVVIHHMLTLISLVNLQ